MKKYIYIAFVALMALSCTHDPFEGHNSQGEANVSLSFEIPASELITTYSATDDAARENAIARLDVFAFDQTGAIVADKEGHVVLTNVTLIEGKGRAMIAVTIPAGSTSVSRQFGILANAPDVAAVEGVTTLDEFRALEFSQGTTMRTTSFLMSDISALNTIDNTNPTINLSLRRAMARVDVLLEDAVTNFEITSARLINVRDKGFVFGKNTKPDDISSPLAVPGSSTLVNYDMVNATTDEQKRNFSAQLYCPENYNADKNKPELSTAVIIGGTYKGATTYYRVNLHDNNRDAQVRRNYIYRVNIKGVNGAGNPDADAAINDIPQNLDYTIVEWDYSLHSDVIFDGKNYLGVSQKSFSLPKGADSRTIDVVTNYAQDEWKIESCDEAGTPVTTPSWLTLTKGDRKIDFTLAENTASDAAPRKAYLLISVPTNSHMKMIASIQQYHTDVSIVTFEPQIITASWNASAGLFKSKATLHAAYITWRIESLNLLEDKEKNWCRLSGATVVGSTGTTTAAGDGFELVFDVSQMSASLLARTATVTVRVTDNGSGFTETRNVTLTQSGISNTISVSRLYVGKTAEIDVEKIDINTSGAWSASFKSGDAANATDGCTWLSFTDASYTALADPAKCSGSGTGAIYVKFDACGANTVRSGYIVVTNGTSEQWIRVHQGDYRTVKINGYEMLDRNLGATSAPSDPRAVITAPAPTNGYYYQWGRRPDGHEALAPATAANSYPAPSTAAHRVTRQPVKGDPAFGKFIAPIAAATNEPATGHWLYPDGSITPINQRTIGELWDSGNEPSNTLSATNYTSVRTEYDPCPDGWRVPTAREMESILKYGAAQLQPINGQSVVANHGRFISTDDGRAVYFPTSNNRWNSTTSSFALDPTFKSPISSNTASNVTLGWYWTSSYSASGSPYAVRLYRSDTPDVLYTQKRDGLPAIYPPSPNATENQTGAHLMSVRCIRDRKIAEQMSVSVRRRTVDADAQEFTSRLTTKNLTGGWSATSNASWLTVSPAAGSGDGELSIRVTKNDTPEVRQGEIRITTPSGTVASVVVIQLDDSGIAVTGADGKKRWWRNRNVGATNPNFITIPTDVTELNDESLGSYYGWGAKVPSRWTGTINSIVSNTPPNSWNLVSTQATNSNYPYPIKNAVNDPCPAGWRVPSYWELETTYVKKAMTDAPKSDPITKVKWANNRSFKADNGATYFFPALGYRLPYVANQGTYGYYWSSFENASLNAYFLYWYSASPALMNFNYTNKSYGQPVRCVQETSDSFD